MTAVLLVAATAAHLGFQATVRLVVYPALTAERDASPERWARVHGAHSRRITVVVAAVYGALLLACGAVALAGRDAWTESGTRAAGWLVALVCTATVLLVTAVGAAPVHGALGRTEDVGRRRLLLGRLLALDTARLLGAAGACGGALVAAAGGTP